MKCCSYFHLLRAKHILVKCGYRKRIHIEVYRLRKLQVCKSINDLELFPKQKLRI